MSLKELFQQTRLSAAIRQNIPPFKKIQHFKGRLNDFRRHPFYKQFHRRHCHQRQTHDRHKLLGVIELPKALLSKVANAFARNKKWSGALNQMAEAGIEPARRVKPPRDFKSRASANFATRPARAILRRKTAFMQSKPDMKPACIERFRETMHFASISVHSKAGGDGALLDWFPR